MSLKTEVLNYLCAHDDEYVSGEALAQKFDKSRAAVWKAIKSLQSDGVHIEAVTNRGYRLLPDNDILTAKRLKRILILIVVLFFIIPSTAQTLRLSV